jgi:exopolysaccharide biosynthesis WecB/TagA/CpsF family protein
MFKRLSLQQDFPDNIESILSPGEIISFINPFSVKILMGNQRYIEDLQSCSRVYVDGMLMCRYLSMILGEKVNRVSFDGNSLAPKVFCRILESNRRIAFIGGNEKEAAMASDKLAAVLGESLSFVDHGYQDFDSENTMAAIVRRLSNHKADVLVLGLGAPLQERVSVLINNLLPDICVITCGGYITQISRMSRLQYYPDFIEKNNLRFLYRVYREGFPMLKRYIFDYLPFYKLAFNRVIRG